MSATHYKERVPRQLAQRLLAFRDTMHAPACHDAAPNVDKTEAAPNALPCNVAGYCVHGPDGVINKAMHTSLNRVLLAQRLPKINKSGRKLLTEAGIVVCAMTERRDVVDGPAGFDSVGPDPVKVTANQWLHLGCVDLPPRSFDTQQLFHCEDKCLHLGSDPFEAVLQRVWGFTNAWLFVRGLGKMLVWRLRFFTFVRSPRLIGTLDVSKLSVVELDP